MNVLKVVFCIAIVGLIGLPLMAFENSAEEQTIELPLGNEGDFSHSVFAEFITATWCPYCRYAHAAFRNIYQNEWYPFYYVSLVYDVNSNAVPRLNELSTYYLPTAYFDGGYEVYVGGDPGGTTESYYNTSILSSGENIVADVTSSLSVMWLEDATMNIDISLFNNEVLGYNGNLRIYVTEITSSMGWIDTGDVPYTNAFLDYAFNDNISIEPKSTWGTSIVWNGNEHDDGYGNTFSTITYDNILVIAVLFNEEKHQAYAVPPNEQPFDAYYVDETVAAVPSVDTTSPEIEMTFPQEGYLHMFNRAIFPVGSTIILGDITIKADATDADTGIGTIEFYIDDELQSTVSSYPYEWTLEDTLFLKHTIKTIAKDLAGNTASDEQEIIIFNL
jgi:hypothetical protein